MKKPENHAEEHILGEIEVLKEEVARLRKLLKSEAKSSAEESAVAQAIREVVPKRSRVSVPRRKKLDKEKDIESAVLVLSDIHYGEVVDETATGGIAVYSTDIARRRFDYTIDKAIQMAKEKMGFYHIPRFYVFGLGDWISGLIIEDIERYSEVQVMEQCFECAEMAEKGILKLCQEFEEVVFVGIGGNHARLRPQVYFKAKQVESFDYLVYKLLEQRFRDQPNIRFNIPRSFFVIQQVEQTRFYLMHGDAIRPSNWAGIPWYAVQRDYLKFRQLMESFGNGFDHMVIGHYHQPSRFIINRDEVIMNGSLKGGDEYSLGAARGACDPTMFFFGVSPTFGITWEWRIKSGHIR